MKKVLTGIGAIAFTIALTGVVIAAGQTTTLDQNQSQVQSGNSGSKTNIGTHNSKDTGKGGQQNGNSGSGTDIGNHHDDTTSNGKQQYNNSDSNKEKQHKGDTGNSVQHGYTPGTTGDTDTNHDMDAHHNMDMEHMNTRGHHFGGMHGCM